LILPVPSTASTADKNADRPKLPYNVMGLQRQDIDAYDSRAEPVANAATAALLALNKKPIAKNAKNATIAAHSQTRGVGWQIA